MKRKSVILAIGILFLASILGCEAFVRKFTRKPKKENLPHEELVLTPEEYKGPQMTKEELYRQNVLYWQSWQGELIESLSAETNHKKQLDCARQALSYLSQMRSMLNETRQKELDAYVTSSRELLDAISDDTYGTRTAQNRLTAERLKMKILKRFSYPDVKNDLL